MNDTFAKIWNRFTDQTEPHKCGGTFRVETDISTKGRTVTFKKAFRCDKCGRVKTLPHPKRKEADRES